LAERTRERLARRKNVEEKKMFGGIGFLLNGNLLGGVRKDRCSSGLAPRTLCGKLVSGGPPWAEVG